METKKNRTSNRKVDGNKIGTPSVLAPSYINTKAEGVQLVSGFIPSLYCGGNNKYGKYINLLPESYSDKPIKKMNAKEVDPKLMTCLKTSLRMNGLCLDGPKPIHIYKNGESKSKYTDVHTDPVMVIIVMLHGMKIVWVAGKEPNIDEPFIDLAGNKWVSTKNSSMTRQWSMSDRKGSLTNGDDLGPIFHAAGFRRCTLGPGDALLVPARFLHAVCTEANSIGLSLTVKKE